MQTFKSPRARHKDDPSAFGKRFAVIRPVIDDSLRSPLQWVNANVKLYSMGKCKIQLHPADDTMGWFMSVQRSDRYPDWDEIVYLRYMLIPDAALMSLLLPNLNAYINDETDSGFRNTFTMEQRGWALDPPPICVECGAPLVIAEEVTTNTVLHFRCPNAHASVEINPNTWNEQHGNGRRVVR